MFLKSLIAFLALTTAAFAGVPTDIELLTDRAQAAEAQAKYLTSILLRIEAKDKETSEYWAKYIVVPK
jgi:hypothetical protein